MRRFFSRSPRSMKQSTFRPRLEPLEDRVTPVIGAYVPNPVPTGFVTVDGVALDGVVKLTLHKPGGEPLCTGSLLRSQRHILTAAHCVTDDNGRPDVTQVTVTFTFSGWDEPVEYTVMPSAIEVHPRWNGKHNDGYDIAVLTLPSLAPSGPAGLGATGYLLNTSFQEVGKQFEFAGFGRTGGGDTGGIPGTHGSKRLGYNRFDTRTKPVPFIGSDTGLAFDFDDGSVFNNTLFAWGSPKTPVKVGDSMNGEGDSGGPSFLNGLLAGVISGAYAVNDFDPDGTFGDIGVVERVSLHRNWIESFTDAGYDLEIRMNKQRPADGVKDTLKLLREGTNVVFYVNDQFYYLDASSRLSSVTIVGSSDSEDFLIDSDLRKIVNFQGGGGTNRVFVRNSSDKATYEVSEGKVSTIMGLRALTLNYGGVKAVEVAGDSSDTVKVISVRSGTPLTVINAGTVDIGGVSGGNLSAIKDTVTVNGSSTLLNINDATWANRRDYDVSNNQLMVDPFRLATTIRYQGLSILNLQGGSAGNVFTVFGTPALIARLYTGAGADITNVYATSFGTFAIEGQGGNDTVTVGLGRSVQSIRGVLRIRNTGGYSTVNLENQADSAVRDVTLEDTSGGYVTVRNLAPGAIRVDRDSTRALNIWAGDGGNGFTIHSTPDSNLFAGTVGTTIHTGNGHDVVNVHGTRGALALDGQLGTNQVFVGSPTAGLDGINSSVELFGSGGANYLTVNDFAATTGHAYVLDRNVVQRSDRPAISFQTLSGLSFTAGTSAQADTITVRDTVPNIVTDISYGGGGDNITVERTGPGLVILRVGATTLIEVGTNTSSLDYMQSLIRVVCAPNNLVRLRLNDTAATARRDLAVSGTDSGQRYELAASGSGQWRTLVEVFFSPLLGAPVANFEYVGGSGGTTAFVYSTTVGTGTSVYGRAGVLDNFYAGWAGDMNRNLGRISFNGQAADNDYAIYYDYLNPNPQTYTVTGDSFFQTLFIDRPGTGGVSSIGLGQVVFYAPGVGDSVENVRGVPAGTFLNMAVGADTVTLGGGPLGLAVLQGPVAVGGYEDAKVTMTVDNSGDFRMGSRLVTLRERQGQYDYGHHIEGFAPATISWQLAGASTLALRGSAADETFAMLSTSFGIPISIDGGGGNNALDYSNIQAAAGQVSRYRADGDATDAVGTNHGTLVNGATFGRGRFGQAFDFDGSGDYVDLGSGPSLDLPGSMSVSLWVRLDTLTPWKYFFGDFNSGSAARQGSLGVGLTPFWEQSYTNGEFIRFHANTPMQVGQWYHLCVVRDDAAKTVRLYVDGIEEASHRYNYAGWTVVPLQSSKFLGGSGPLFPIGSLDGQLDEIGIFNRALSAAEVQALYSGGSTGLLDNGPGVTVNLPLGMATGLGGGIARIQNVIGSSGNDILVGNGGNALFGGAGRDLLIAGILASQLYGGADEDLLIGGTLNDSSRANLDTIMAEWTRTGDGNDYAARVARLRASLLADDKITGNGGGNTLTGEGGLDLFFGSFVTDWQVDDGEWVFPL